MVCCHISEGLRLIGLMNDTDYDQHDHHGPLQIDVPSTTGRIHPLGDAVYASFEDVGIEALPGFDAKAGDNIGIG